MKDKELIACTSCHAAIASDAETCPNCGQTYWTFRELGTGCSLFVFLPLSFVFPPLALVVIAWFVGYSVYVANDIEKRRKLLEEIQGEVNTSEEADLVEQSEEGDDS